MNDTNQDRRHPALRERAAHAAICGVALIWYVTQKARFAERRWPWALSVLSIAAGVYTFSERLWIALILIGGGIGCLIALSLPDRDIPLPLYGRVRTQPQSESPDTDPVEPAA